MERGVDAGRFVGGLCPPTGESLSPFSAAFSPKTEVRGRALAAAEGRCRARWGPWPRFCPGPRAGPPHTGTATFPSLLVLQSERGVNISLLNGL